MARDSEQRDDSEREFWTFPPLETRMWQQFCTIDRSTGQKTFSRTCTRCGQFMLVRCADDTLADLSRKQRRFVEQNRTPCED